MSSRRFAVATGLAELLVRREVFLALVWRDLKMRYRGSALGFFLTLANPLIFMAIYSLVFSVYIRIEIPNYPIFVFSGLLPWNWFASAVLSGANAIVEGSSLLKRVPLPPQILPAVIVTSTLVNFLLALPILFAFMLVAGVPIGWALLLLPAPILIQFAFTLALATALSALTVRYRDLQQLLANLLMLWFFMTPILYSASLVPEAFRSVLLLNPMMPLIVAYQDIFYRGRAPAMGQLGAVALVAAVLLVLAFSLFERRRWTLVEDV